MVDNCLFYDNGVNVVQFIYGGSYQFDYCIVVSYGVDVLVLVMNNFQCYNDDCFVNFVFLLEVEVINCIFFGLCCDEIIIQDVFE